MYDLNEINERHGHYSSPYQDTESELTPDKRENDSTYQKQEIAPQIAANEPTGVLKEDDSVRRLVVGDKLYRISYNEITGIVVIARTTKTQALSKDGRYKFRIELCSIGIATKMGDTDKWSSAAYRIETEKLKEKLFRQGAIKELEEFEYYSLTTEKLKQIIALLKS